MDDDDDVESRSQREMLIENQIANLPFQPVADDGPFHAAPGPQPHPCHRLAVRQDSDGELHALGPSSSSVHGMERVRELERNGPGTTGMR